ncbi:N-acetylneuraminate synthase family protein [Flavobacteriaceae bacterium]|nr:N-acetylneuraminate synthase family protein [Flavobacteriaceae bacterium]
MSSFKLNGRIISEKSKPYTIAEVGINHNGKLDNAIRMIEIAKNSGVDCVKFQTFTAEEIIIDKSTTYTYKTSNKTITESMFEMFKRYELDIDSWQKIKEYCDNIEIDFMSTPQNPKDMDLLNKIGVKSIKIGSDDFNNIPLIKYYLRFNLPIIMSTGMANEKEILEVINLFEEKKFNDYAFLLCTSSYPTPLNQVNLNKIKKLKELLNNKVIGFSDHTEGDFSSMIAVGLGARIFEKHFTEDKNNIGPDHRFSMNPKELKQWVESIHLSFEILGNEQLEPTENEIEIKKIARRTITVISDISKGEIFSLKNLGLRRPNVGLSPNVFEEIIGTECLTNLKKGDKLKLSDY